MQRKFLKVFLGLEYAREYASLEKSYILIRSSQIISGLYAISYSL